MKFAAALFAAICGTVLVISSPVAAQETANRSVWSDRITTSPEGGHVMGNPVAKFRLTEFMSYVCPRCGQFERDSHKPLKANFVDRGHISFEVRHLVLNRLDMAAALMARCGPRTRFFDDHNAMLGNQMTMLRRFDALDTKAKAEAGKGTVNERLIKTAEGAGLFIFMQDRGYTRAELVACLSDKKQQDMLTAMTDYAVKLVEPARAETPTFTLNGKYIGNVRDWAPLEAGLNRLPQ
ncbi:MAG: thioredoxin domain-containing protein [Pseudomonadota bacterium]